VQARTLLIFALLVLAFVLLGLPAYVGPSFLEPFSAYVALVPLMSVYVFHGLGVPGLLEHKGSCGWGLCDPTPFGYVFLAALWLALLWLLAWGIARLSASSR